MIITCHSCSSTMRVPDNAAGRKGKCPKCGLVLTIPAPTPVDEAITAEPLPEHIEPGPPPLPEGKPGGRRPWEGDDEEDEDEVERGLRRLRHRRKQENVGLSVASMIVGICAVLSATCLAVACGLLSTPVTGTCGLVAVVLGILGMNRGGRGMAITGITLGAVAIVLAIACGIVGSAFVGFALMHKG